jgi:hypothetical protein
MTRRRRGGHQRDHIELPARRVACCRQALPALEAVLGGSSRVYIAARDDAGRLLVDVLDEHGVLREPLTIDADDPVALAAAMLEDATGHPPRPATISQFADDVVRRQPAAGFAISSADVCGWLLLRAIERSESRQA